MSYSKRDRGLYIRKNIHYNLLIDLALERITADQAGYVYNLISFISAAGTTSNRDLAKNHYYTKAIENWRICCEIKRARMREKMKVTPYPTTERRAK